MSQENVELARRLVDAVNRRDLGACLALMDLDVKAAPRLAAVEGGYQGHEGMRRWWENLHDAFPDFSNEVVEVRDLGDLTLTALHLRGHGAGSDVPVDQTTWVLHEWRSEKIVSWSAHGTEADALDAVRLRE
jgi:ketosteroid isomerase-like protein